MELPDDESDTTEFRGRCPGPAQEVVQGFLRRLYNDDPAIGERAAPGGRNAVRAAGQRRDGPLVLLSAVVGGRAAIAPGTRGAIFNTLVSMTPKSQEKIQFQFYFFNANTNSKLIDKIGL